MKTVVAIPVCNEEAHIAGCLGAFDGQCGDPADPFGVVLFLNNCRDRTLQVIEDIKPALPYPLRIIVRDHPAASAGWARRCALDAAAVWLDEVNAEDGILLTTDADSRVPQDWIARNRAAMAAGADLVAGRLTLDPADMTALPPALIARGALEAAYEALVDEIVAWLDPISGDPWPTHACHSGASLAVRLDTYRLVGGMPDIPCGEDRAFVQAVLAHDRIVRHDPDIVVVTSGRLSGRAKGGVADTIRLRCEVPDSPCDDRLENVGRIVARTKLRRHLRRLHVAGCSEEIGRLVARLSVDRDISDLVATKPAFGALYGTLEELSPLLAYRPVTPKALPREIRRARSLLRLLRTCRENPRVAACDPVIRDKTAAAAFD